MEKIERIVFNAPTQGLYDKIFSNFAFSPVNVDGVFYPTVEHAFQAQKTLDKDERREMSEAMQPGIAKKMGRRVQLRADWEDVKYDAMVACLREKFKIPYYRRILLHTKDKELIEDASGWNDTEWGVGVNGDGKNLLGKALMQVREEIKNELQEDSEQH